MTYYLYGISKRSSYLEQREEISTPTKVTGSLTFQARELFVSKQKDTTGVITVSENSGATTLVTMGPDERAPRFKIISLFPEPGSAITISIEYYTRMNLLENDSDTPPFDRKWHYIVRLGTIAKVYQYLNKETDFITQHGLYSASVRSMVSADKHSPDLIEYMSRRVTRIHTIHLRRSESAIA